MKPLDSKSETRASSAWRSSKLRQALLVAGLLLLLTPEPWAPPPEPSVQAYPVWQIEVAQESMARAFASLTGTSLVRARKIVSIVDREAAQYGMDPFRVLAFIMAESWGDPRAKSHVGARGLMQIMPATGRVIARGRQEDWGGINSLYEVETNITYGAWYYHHLLVVFEGNDAAAIAAYNWGPVNVRQRIRYGRRLPQVYPGKVLQAQAKLEKEFAREASARYWQGFIAHNPDPRTDEGATLQE